MPGVLGGPADALNKALRAARGSLIGWLNADNLYPPPAPSAVRWRPMITRRQRQVLAGRLQWRVDTAV